MRRAEAGIQVDKFYPPTDWLDNNNKQIDIRKNAENNSIVLLVGHSADFSKYSLLGLLANTSSGTYDVYIDDVLVGSGITKNTQYDIDFSTINTSYGGATTPESLVLHKVVIKPTTSGEKIIKFSGRRTAGVSTTQQQGLLWCHFELSNVINEFSFYYNNLSQPNFKAITSQNDILILNGMYVSFGNLSSLLYIPMIYSTDTNNSMDLAFYNCRNLKRIKIQNMKTSVLSSRVFENCFNLEQILLDKIRNSQQIYYSNRKLKLINNVVYSNSNLTNFIIEATKLYPTKIEVADKTTTKLGMYGTSTYPTRGLRGLKVSNEAPFTGASPQINVSYTGLDRDALVELFNSLPTVTGSQILKCDHCIGTADLTDEDKAIATNKGWGLTLS